MEKIKFIFLSLVLGSFAWAENFSVGSTSLWEESRYSKISDFSSSYGMFFNSTQGGNFYGMAALIAILALGVVFLLHHFSVGAKSFSEDGKKILAFNKFERFIHTLAAVSWVVLLPTGLIMLFGKIFGAEVANVCRNLHQFFTFIFAISIVPMFLIWFLRMLPAGYDFKWFAMLGGYLSKAKKPVPAGKFNAGQKAWFWVAMLGGAVMILSGAFMYFSDYNLASTNVVLGQNQMELLRLSAALHNALGVVCIAFFIVHIYMAVFGVKGSLNSILNGYKSEEEVYILHHYWYQELLKDGKIQRSKFEDSYQRL